MKLTAVAGFTRGVRWEIGPNPIVLGRASDCDITIDDVTVSRRHCSVCVADGAVHVKDLGSVNRFTIDGVTYEEAVLHPGGQFSVGSASFKVSETDSADPSTPIAFNTGETQTMSLAAFYERYSHNFPQSANQDNRIIVLRMLRALAAAKTLAELVRSIEDSVAIDYPDAQFWMFEASEDVLRRVCGPPETESSRSAQRSARLAIEEDNGVLSNGVPELSSSGVIAVPLIVGPKAVGAIVLSQGDCQPQFSDADLQTAMLFGELIAPFLESMLRGEYLAEVNARLARVRNTETYIIGHSKAMQRLRATIRDVAQTSLDVIIVGESGTGKELVARGIHDISAARHEPFVAINCAAVPHELFENEFFGHVEGAFTGASSARTGAMARADGGTLFLDEVAELTPENQAKLLRAIESRSFCPIGADEERTVSFRVIAATNKDLSPPRFREDLYHRLCGVLIETPPLRAHPSDIPELAQHFLDTAIPKLKGRRVVLSDDAVEFLSHSPWPGNARELRNWIARTVQLTGASELGAEHFRKFGVNGNADDRAVLKPLKQVEQDHIEYVLAQTGGNMNEAAKALGISRSTLYTKVPVRDRNAE